METDADEISGKDSGWRGSRELWLAAARDAFVEAGLDAVKIQPLASRLNLSRTSFYWFFKNREELLTCEAAAFDADSRIEKLSPAVIHEAFKQYFPMDRYTVVTLKPETAGQ